jgi:hypothetical protein
MIILPPVKDNRREVIREWLAICTRIVMIHQKGKLIGGFFALLFLLSACLGNDRRPPGILSREEMARVLEQIYLTEGKINQLSLPVDSASQVFKAVQGKVFQEVGVTDSAFKRSFDYYMDHPAEMELIYSALVDSLNLKEQRTPPTH